MPKFLGFLIGVPLLALLVVFGIAVLIGIVLLAVILVTVIVAIIGAAF